MAKKLSTAAAELESTRAKSRMSPVSVCALEPSLALAMAIMRGDKSVPTSDRVGS